MANPKPPRATLAAGTPAPGFSLMDAPDHYVSLADFIGMPVVLVFYSADFSPNCTRMMTLFNEVLPELHRYRAQLMGISPDSVWSHLAFAREFNLHFPLLADYHPKGWIAGAYGAYSENDGLVSRSVYVVAEDGKVAWGFVAPDDETIPGADGVLEALGKLPGLSGAVR